MEVIARPNLPTIPIKFSFDIPKELGNDASVVANFPGFDQFKGQILDAMEDYANLAVAVQNGSHFSITLKDIKEPVLKINGKEMDIPKIMEAFQKAKGNPEHRDFFFTNFIKVLRNGKSVDAFVKEVDKFKPGEKAAKEKPKPKNEVKKTEGILKRAKSDRDYLESIYDETIYSQKQAGNSRTAVLVKPQKTKEKPKEKKQAVATKKNYSLLEKEVSLAKIKNYIKALGVGALISGNPIDSYTRKAITPNTVKEDVEGVFDGIYSGEIEYSDDSQNQVGFLRKGKEFLGSIFYGNHEEPLLAIDKPGGKIVYYGEEAVSGKLTRSEYQEKPSPSIVEIITSPLTAIKDKVEEFVPFLGGDNDSAALNNSPENMTVNLEEVPNKEGTYVPTWGDEIIQKGSGLIQEGQRQIKQVIQQGKEFINEGKSKHNEEVAKRFGADSRITQRLSFGETESNDQVEKPKAENKEQAVEAKIERTETKEEPKRGFRGFFSQIYSSTPWERTKTPIKTLNEDVQTVVEKLSNPLETIKQDLKTVKEAYQANFSENQADSLETSSLNNEPEEIEQGEGLVQSEYEQDTTPLEFEEPVITANDSSSQDEDFSKDPEFNT